MTKSDLLIIGVGGAVVLIATGANAATKVVEAVNPANQNNVVNKGLHSALKSTGALEQNETLGGKIFEWRTRIGAALGEEKSKKIIEADIL